MKRSRLRSWLLRGALAVAAAGFLLLAFLATWPPLSQLRATNPPTTAFIEARKKELRGGGRSDRIERSWVPLSAISPHLRQAVVAAEDDRFWEHGGIDWNATREAAKAAWKRQSNGKPPKRGGSTITQQLAKNLYLSPERSYLRKIREAAIALRLERELTKNRILEIYLNSIEWGERVYGAEAASRRYFGKNAAALAPEEAAWLAAMIPGPRRALNPALHPERVARRQKKILRLMAAGSGLEGHSARPVSDDDEE